MGNQILKDYKVGDNPIASGGTNHIWKIYPAIHKTSKKHQSIFMCEVADIARTYGTDNKSKVVERLKIDTEIITKFRKPSFLQVVQPLAEMKQSIVFITEPVLGSVANLCFNEYSHVANPKQQERMNDIEVKLGLGQVLQQLTHLHSKGLAHLNVNPTDIYITSKGQWKLGGFQFCMSKDDMLLDHAKYKPSFASYSDIVKNNNGGIKNNYFLPPLDFTAPEYVLQDHWSIASDIYSFGQLYYNLLHKDQNRLIDSGWNVKFYQNMITQTPVAESEANKGDKKKKKKGRFGHSDQLIVDMDLYNKVKPLIEFNDRNRMAAKAAYRATELFGDEVKALRFIDKINTKPATERSQFFSKLITVLPKYSENILAQKILRHLLPALMHPICRESALHNILEIITLLPSRHFSNTILPALQQNKIFSSMELPKIPLLLLSYFRKLVEASTESEQKNTILPFLSLCLESSHPEVQIDSLNQCCMAVTNNYLPYSYFKEYMLPTILEIARSTPEQIVRQCTINCIYKTIEYYEVYVLTDSVIPVLKYLLNVDKSSSVIMAITYVFEQIAHQFTQVEDVATILIPTLAPVMVEPTLSIDNFNEFMKIFQNMINKVAQSRDHYYSELKAAEISARTVNSKAEAKNNPFQQSSSTQDAPPPLPRPRVRPLPTPATSKPAIPPTNATNNNDSDDHPTMEQSIQEKEEQLRIAAEVASKREADEAEQRRSHQATMERQMEEIAREEERKRQEEEAARRREMDLHLEAQRQREERENAESLSLLDKLEQAQLMRMKFIEDEDEEEAEHDVTKKEAPSSTFDDLFDSMAETQQSPPSVKPSFDIAHPFDDDPASSSSTPLHTTPAEFLQSPTSSTTNQAKNGIAMPDFGLDSHQDQDQDAKMTPLAFFDD